MTGDLRALLDKAQARDRDAAEALLAEPYRALLGTSDVVAWASNVADALAAEKTSAPRHWVPNSRPLCRVLFTSLLDGGVPLEPRWDILLPTPFTNPPEHYALVARALRAMPVERRGPAVVMSLAFELSTAIVAIGLDVLAEFPSRELAALVVVHAAQATSPPQRETLRRLAELARTHAVIADALPARRQERIELAVRNVRRPRVVAELTALEQKQLSAAGRLYDGRRASAAARLGEKRSSATSFAGSIEIRDIVDASGNDAYVAYLVLVDAGTVFRAGGTDVVATIIQGSLQCDDDDVREALQVVTQT